MSLAADQRVTVTTAGFVITDERERTLAYEEHFEEALNTMRNIERAEFVFRVSDDALCAKKHRFDGPNFWSGLWNDRSVA